MFDTINARIDGWMTRWSHVIVSPNEPTPSEPRISGFEFFAGNTLAAYIAAFASALFFFLVLYRDALFTSMRTSLETDLKIAAGALLAYLLINLLMLVISAVLCYVVYRLCRSRTSFKSHVDAFFDMSALDPVAAIAITLVLLGEMEGVVGVAGLCVFTLTRVWYLAIGYRAMHRAHSLPTRKRFIAYFLGFVPSAVILNGLTVAVMSLFAMMLVAGWD